MISAALSVLLALALLYGPGAAVAAVFRRRPLTILAVAPALTFAVVAVGTMVTTALEIRWTPAAVAAWVVLAVLVAALLSVVVGAAERRWRRARPRADDPDPAADGRPAVGTGRGALAAGVMVALSAVAGAAQIVVASDRLTRPLQFWDAVFHGVAIRYIVDTGKASPFSLAGAAQPANPDFYYPDVYHAIGALLLQLPGQEMPPVLSALSAATVVVFVIGSASVAARLGAGPVAVAAAAVAASSTWSFPFGRLNWGPVLPYALGVAAITGVLVLGIAVVRERRVSVRAALLLGAAMAGLLAVHPSVGAGAAILLAFLLLCAGPGFRLPAAVTLAGAAVVALVLFIPQLSLGAGASVAGFRWPKTYSLLRVAGEYFGVAESVPASVVWWLLLAVGVVALVRARRRPALALALAAAAFSAVFVLAYAVSADWAHLFTAVWWDDANRLAALMMVAATPLVGLGAAGLIAAVGRRRATVRTVAAVVVVAVAAGAALAGHLGTQRVLTRAVYGDGPAVTPDEAEIFADLARRYDGGLVLGDPFDGSSWVYSLYGIPVVIPAPFAEDPGRQVGAPRMLLYTSMNRYGYDPGVTITVRNLDVRWVLVGSGVIGGPGRPPGFEGMGRNPHLELVAANDGARLYRVLPVPDHPPLPPAPGIPTTVPPIAWEVESLDVVGGPDRPGEP